MATAGVLGRPAWRFPLLVFLVWRLAHAVAVVALGGHLFDDTFRFDSLYYLDILDDGYEVTDPSYEGFEDVSFLPGLPWITWAVRLVLRSDRLSAFVVANAFAAAAFVAVGAAVRSWTDEHRAHQALVALALWPSSLFLWAYYTEGLFITVSAVALWGERRKAVPVTVAAVAVAAMTRTSGVLLGPVLAAVRIFRRRRVDAVSIGYLAASAAGLGMSMATQEVQAGDALGFVHGQRAFGAELSPPWESVVDAVSFIAEKLPGLAAEVSLNLVAVIVFLGLGLWLVAGALGRSGRWRIGRWPLEAAVWAVTVTVASLCTGLVSSHVRYVLGAWPGFGAAGEIADRLPRWITAAAVAVLVTTSLLLIRRWVTGGFVA